MQEGQKRERNWNRQKALRFRKIDILRFSDDTAILIKSDKELMKHILGIEYKQKINICARDKETLILKRK